MLSAATEIVAVLLSMSCCPYIRVQTTVHASAGDGLITDNILHYHHSSHVISLLLTMLLK
jgi:hypothetical protein